MVDLAKLIKEKVKIYAERKCNDYSTIFNKYIYDDYVFLDNHEDEYVDAEEFNSAAVERTIEIIKDDIVDDVYNTSYDMAREILDTLNETEIAEIKQQYGVDDESLEEVVDNMLITDEQLVQDIEEIAQEAVEEIAYDDFDVVLSYVDIPLIDFDSDRGEVDPYKSRIEDEMTLDYDY